MKLNTSFTHRGFILTRKCFCPTIMCNYLLLWSGFFFTSSSNQEATGSAHLERVWGHNVLVSHQRAPLILNITYFCFISSDSAGSRNYCTFSDVQDLMKEDNKRCNNKKQCFNICNLPTLYNAAAVYFTLIGRGSWWGGAADRKCRQEVQTGSANRKCRVWILSVQLQKHSTCWRKNCSCLHISVSFHHENIFKNLNLTNLLFIFCFYVSNLRKVTLKPSFNSLCCCCGL